ncbi:zinc ribbon domain-containing protein [Bacillus massilinigeriensis]|uniref:zinc ribbon domain-containing protein n=1 Tax=Bacillus massilionigeriensis TaxID=1805475 RepID=UPI00096B15E7|nr:zinc ribbon domain-containing protein [Bacillus massilionigeriensis]
MNIIEEKLNNGMNLQDSQTLNNILQESGLKRNEVLLQLGEEYYKKIRSEGITSDDLKGKIDIMIELDRTIFQCKRAMAELEAGHGDVCSSCRAPVSKEDKFCGECGAKIDQPEQKEVLETVACPSCKEQIPVNSTFCPCCGMKRNN